MFEQVSLHHMTSIRRAIVVIKSIQCDMERCSDVINMVHGRSSVEVNMERCSSNKVSRVVSFASDGVNTVRGHSSDTVNMERCRTKSVQWKTVRVKM